MLLPASTLLGPAASAQNADNEQVGDNTATHFQGGSSRSGDANGGQVVGAVSSGDTEIDARNRTEDAEIESGPSDAGNQSNSFVGLDSFSTSSAINDCAGGSGEVECSIDAEGEREATNFQEGDNDLVVRQTAAASSGDAVAGQVVGSVTSAGGSADIVGDNRSEDTEVVTGEADAFNAVFSFTGLAMHSSRTAVNSCGNGQADSDETSCAITVGADTLANDQEGDNSANVTTSATASSGDGVGGQVIGTVDAGDTSIDARNRTEDADIRTGTSGAANVSGVTTGLVTSGITTVANFCGNVEEGEGGENQTACSVEDAGSTGENTQVGENDLTLAQATTAASGDGVAGQVIGSVTSGGGSADVAADNVSEDVDIETGEAFAAGVAGAFAGLALDFDNFVANSCGNNLGGTSTGTAACAVTHGGDTLGNDLDGDNTVDVTTSSTASSGDGVGGQVIGSVAAGDTSIDARNRSEDVDVSSGAAESVAAGGPVAGLIASSSSTAGNVCGNVVDGEADGTTAACSSEIGADRAENSQTGENEITASQSAEATSGDGVGGQVIGSVTTASGSADIAAANESEDVSVETGDALAADVLDATAGQGLTHSRFPFATFASPTFGFGSGASNVCGNTISGDSASSVAACSVESGSDDIRNTQDGDNSADLTTSATASSGDGVGGQVIGTVSAGDTEIDARNRSEDAEVVSGAALGVNLTTSATGPQADARADDVNSCGNNVGGFAQGNITACSATSDDNDYDNLQSGDNDLLLSQSADATTGDGVGGQVIGAVTSAGGSADITADNGSEDVNVETGDAVAAGDVVATTGPGFAFVSAPANDCGNAQGFLALSQGNIVACSSTTGGTDVLNDRTGDDSAEIDIAATASSGDGVGGQVIGSTSAGDTSIDARNRSEDVDIATGVAAAVNGSSGPVTLSTGAQVSAGNSASNFCGNQLFLAFAFDNISACSSEAGDTTVTNTHDGDNELAASYTAEASSGDGVGGQVIGSVTTASGSAEIVADNRSEDIDVETGDAAAGNDSVASSGSAADGVGGADNFCGNTLLGSTSDTIAACSAATGEVTAASTQDGDNSTSLSAAAQASSGDGVGGQVIGSVASGDTSIDARNRSEDVDLVTGAASAENTGDTATGGSVEGDLGAGNDCGNVLIGSATSTIVACSASTEAASADNDQTGDNDLLQSQSASAASGDGVGGQVIGSVTSAGGSADIVAANNSEDVDIETGEAIASNLASAFVGQIAFGEGGALNSCGNVGLGSAASTTTACSASIESLVLSNEQEGDNEVDMTQAADASSGDGVAGQVIGAVSAGDTSIDARNRSDDIDLETGISTAENDQIVFAGQAASGGDFASNDCAPGEVCSDELAAVDGSNVQDGDNETLLGQTAQAASGDAVGGQVIGVVTTAAGSADLVQDNASEDVDAITGEVDHTNAGSLFVGLSAPGGFLFV